MEEPPPPPPPPPSQPKKLRPYTPNSPWEELSPEILALIFTRIPADELVRVVPFVCKSWSEAVAGPYCWTDIDIQRWCRRCNSPTMIDSAVIKLARRSSGTCRRLSAFGVTNAGFSFVANCVKGLKALQMPMSGVTERMVINHAESLKLLTFLDISYCLKIKCKGLEALGKSCTALVHLRRNMPPLDWQQDMGTVSSNKDDGEALVIANTMPALQHLELGYGRFSDRGLDAILTKCKNLSHLDIIGCYGVKMDSVKMESDFEKKCEHLVVFRAPWEDEYQDEDVSDSSEEGEEYFSSSGLDSQDD